MGLARAHCFVEVLQFGSAWLGIARARWCVANPYDEAWRPDGDSPWFVEYKLLFLRASIAIHLPTRPRAERTQGEGAR